MNERPDRRDHSDRGPRKPYNSHGDNRQRRDGEFKPRRDGEFKPRNDDRGYAPRRDDRDRGPRREGEFKPRRDGEFKPRRDGEFKPRNDDRGYAPRRDDRDRGPRRDGEFKPRRDGEFKPRRDGEFKPRRDGEFKPRRDGEFKPRNDDRGYAPRRDDRDRGPRRDDRDRGFTPRRDSDDRAPRRDDRDRGPRREGDFKPRREGDFKPRREGDFKPRREGDFKPRRDGDFKPRRDGDFKPRRDGDFKPRRDDRGFGDRRDDRAPKKDFGRGGTRGGGRSDRGGAGREFTEAERLQHALRPVRSEHDDPVLPEEIQAKDLHPSARNELKTLQADVQDRVAKHLAMVAYLIDEDPELAHQHALSASRRAGRIPVARETLAITAYRTGDFALALRELRTYRRLSGLDGHLALMIDCERGLGRPEKAIETAQAADVSKLDIQERVHLAIAVSGARLDLGQTQQALFELEIPELNPKKAFSWSPELFGAYAAVLEDLGRDTEAARWYARADQAAGAIDSLEGGFDQVEVFEVHEEYIDLEDDAPEQAASASDAPEGVTAEADAAADANEANDAREAHEVPDQDAAPDPELKPETPVSAEEPDASDMPDASTAALSVEDEVAELLAEAGITDTSDEDEAESAEEPGEEAAK